MRSLVCRLVHIGIFLLAWALGVAALGAASFHAQIKVEEYRYQRRLTSDEQQWIDERFKKMRLEEKVGQMFMISVPTSFLNIESEGFKELRQRVLEQRVGGIILQPGEVYEAAVLVDRLQELSRYPLFVAAEVEAGTGMVLRGATNFPWNMAVGATGDPMLAQQQAEAVAQEARVLGVNMLLAPVAEAVHYEPTDSINVRSYGDDPAQVAQYVAAFVRGAQRYGVMAVAKFFPGYARASVPTSGGFMTLGAARDQLEAAEFVPFRSAIAEGVGGVMVGHIAVPSVDPTPLSAGSTAGSLPASLSAVVVSDVLRRGMKFDGLLLTDSLQHGSLASFKGASAVIQAIKAGVDVIVMPVNTDEAIRAVMDAVRQGEIKQEQIDQSVRRILTAKMRLGLPYQRFAGIDILDSFIARSELQQIAHTIARKSITLVRNDRGLVPLQAATLRSIFHIVVTNTDTNASERQSIGRMLTAELQRKIRQVDRIVLDTTTPVERVPTIVNVARGAELVIVSLFIRPQLDGATATLPAVGATLLRQLAESERPLIVISFGSPYLLLDAPTIPTYLCAFGDARESIYSQVAVARALFREIPISGKLPVALPGLYPRGHGLVIEFQGTRKD
ncbi:MAG: glycoside hydrolase family 3 N-terminal domain-containing protein [Acidobacteriota bacterium]|nr:glycoside hydrolase family 3 N-terminal domain-containing protein [Acidobacteriota bacterium]